LDEYIYPKHPVFYAVDAPLSFLYGKNEPASAARCRPLYQLIVKIIPAEKRFFSLTETGIIYSADASPCPFHTVLADWII